MLTAFTASLLLIIVSELGDKTFFIAAILATRHPRRWVLMGAVAALALMTMLSVLMGQVATILSQQALKWAEVCLFTIFGIKLLYQASRMAAASTAEEKEAVEVVAKAEQKSIRTALAVVVKTLGLTFVAEWGDRTQIATIALAATHPPVAVVCGAVLGHAICATIAVSSGRWICRFVSERFLTAVSGGLFLLFAVTALIAR